MLAFPVGATLLAVPTVDTMFQDPWALAARDHAPEVAALFSLGLWGATLWHAAVISGRRVLQRLVILAVLVLGSIVAAFLYTAQPGAIREGTTQAGEHSSFQEPASHVYGVLGAVSYRVGRGALQPYAIFGTGFYSRNAYTAGFTLGTNAGIGADVHARGLWLFTEARMHVFRGAANVTWTTPSRSA